MDPTNTTLEIELGGRKMTLIFDIETFKAFERETGKFYMNWLMSLMEKSQMTVLDIVQEFGEDTPAKPEPVDPLAVLDLDAPQEPEIVKETDWYALKRREIAKSRLAGLVGMADLEAIIWAAYHSPYVEGRKTKWFMQPETIGRMIDEQNYFELVPKVIKSALQNITRSKKPGADEEESPTPRPTAPSPATSSNGGGLNSGPSDDAILNSLTLKSES